MEPRTRILFISYIVIVLLIVGIGVIPYFARGDHKRAEPAPQNVGLEKEQEREEADGTNVIGTAHILDTNYLTHAVRFQLPQDGVVFEEQNDRLYNLMKDRNGRDIVISYQKKTENGSTYYNFAESLEVLPNR